MHENNREISLVDDINTNWETIPFKYDNFYDDFEPFETREPGNSNETAKKKKNQNQFKYALTFKQADRGLSEISLDDAFKSQTITIQHINDVEDDIQEKQDLIRMLDEAIIALEDVINSSESRPKEEKHEDKQQLLKMIKKDFMKQQRYLLTAVHKVFPKNETEAYRVMNKLFDVHFESMKKYVDGTQFQDVVLEKLFTAELIDRDPQRPHMVKLRPIL